MKHVLFLVALVALSTTARSQNIINNVYCDVQVCEVCYDPNDPMITSWPCNAYTLTANCVTVPGNTTMPFPAKTCPAGQNSAWQVCWASPWCDPNACVIVEDSPGPNPPGWPPCWDHHNALPACNGECNSTCVSFATTSPDMEIY